MRLDEQIRERLTKRPTVFPGMSSDTREHYRERFDQMADALLAVLDLHRPETVEYVSVDRDSRVSTDCTECDLGGVPDGWPCTTLRTIAEKLGIEVGDAQG